MNEPSVRTIYEFTCNCGKKTSIRWPWNPVIGIQSPEEVVPQGWLLVLDGDHQQSPFCLCPECKVKK